MMPASFSRALRLALTIFLSLPVIASADGEPMLGFTSEAAAEQRALETRFDSHLDPANLRAWMKEMSARPHPVGSPWGKHNAEMMRDLLRSWGWDAQLEEFHVLFPTPKVRRVEMLAPSRFEAALREPALAADSTSGQTDEILPPYNAFSIDGDVTAEVVFVGYGLPEDYEELRRRGVDVEGKIVLARYGRSWRGIKPKVAAEHGAVGCIIYSDPEDDGSFQGSPYPTGGFRPAFGVQRGSVADMPLYPGDPLTPGVGATKDAERLPRDEAPTLTKIPVLPISATDAQPLLAALGGPMAPHDWRGALPLTYRLGPGPTKVRLQLEFDWKLAPAYNVVAKIEGSVYPDQWILRGNHHDAWVHGATDPVSGMVAVLEEARAIGELMKTGWRPKRTLVYAGWDAEEPGLLGSVEWAEEHAAELRAKAVAYINSDSNSRGFLNAAGSHALQRLVNQVATEVDEPRKEITVGQRVRARFALHGSPAQRHAARSGADLPIAALGSGSDYTPFLQHLGIASLNVSFGGEGEYGQYHSQYDSFDHFLRFMDPDFSYGIALAQVAGRLVLRLSEAEVLPLEFGSLAQTVGGYVDEVVELREERHREAETTRNALEQGLHEAVSNPDKPLLPPQRPEPVPHLNFAPLKNALDGLTAAARKYDAAQAAYRAGGGSLGAEESAELNRLLYRVERAFTFPEGLPGRPWYIHSLYAPGFYTGYGVKTLPGVREAIELGDWEEAAKQTIATGAALERAAELLDQAAERLQAATR